MQLSYNSTHAPAFEGMLADDGPRDVGSYTNEGASPIPYGRGVKQGDSDAWRGKHPYTGTKDLRELAHRVTMMPPPPRLETRGDVPPHLAEAIHGCFAKDPASRPKADDLVEVLTQLVHSRVKDDRLQGSPFRGLDAFSERHAQFFFGRTDEIESFVECIRVQPVLPVIGASGVGKSSFVQAGVIPRLRELGEWSVIRFRPGKDPFAALARAIGLPGMLTSGGPDIAERVPRASSEQTLVTQNELADELLARPKRLAALLAEQARAEGGFVLLLVDQMEEAVTMVADREVRDRFLDAVCGAADDRYEPVRVVFTARDDFLSRLAETPSMQRALERVTVLQLPGERALTEIVTLPLVALGHRYDDDTLVPTMLAEVAGEAAALPLLQFTASLLWERRDSKAKCLRRSDYDAIGGVQGALASHADGVLGQLDPKDMNVVRGVMLRLVAPDGTRRTIEQQELGELLGPRAAHVLKALSDARLLSVRRRTDDVVQYELSHESLVDTWGLLRCWLDEGREESAFIDELTQAATLWSQRGRRRSEVWTADSLAAALRNIDRYRLNLTSTNEAFLAACKKADQARLRQRKALFTGAFALLALVAVISTVKEREADRQRQLATVQRAQADAEGARSALLADNQLESMARVRRSLEISDSFLARSLWRRLAYEPLRWRVTLGGVGEAVAIIPDGSAVVAGEYSGLISVFDADTAAVRLRLRGQEGPISSIAISSDGRYVAYGNHEGETGLWDLSTRTVSRGTAHGTLVERVCFVASTSEVVSASRDGRVFVWQLGSWRARPLGAAGQPVKGLAVSAEGTIAVGRMDGTLELWASTSAPSSRALRPSRMQITTLAFAPSAVGQLAVGLRDGGVTLVDLDSGAIADELEGHTEFVTGIAFSNDGRRLYSSAFDQRLLAWDTATGRMLASFDGHQGGIYALGIDGSGERLASIGIDRSVRVWDSSLLARNAKPIGHRGAVIGVAVAPNGKLVVSVGDDKTVRIWDLASGDQLATGRGHEDAVMRVAVSPDGRKAVTTSMDGTARVWLLPAAKQERVLVGHEASLVGVAFVGSNRVVTTGWDGTARLWRIDDGACVGVLTVGVPMFAVAVSSRADLIVAGGAEGVVRLWHEPFLGPGVERNLGSDTVFDLAFAPQSPVVGAAASGTVAVWNDITKPTPPRILEQSKDLAMGIDFSPNGEQIAVAHVSGRLARWYIESGDVSVFRGHRGEVSDVVYSPDGKIVATAGDDGTVRTWRADAVAPLWRTALAYGEPFDGVFTHKGWTGAASRADPMRWREAVAAAPSIARRSGNIACIPMPLQGVQLFDLRRDEVVARATRLRPDMLRVVGQGCLVVDETAEAWLLTESTEPVLLAKGVRAVDHNRETPLVATDDEIIQLSASGDSLRVAVGEPGITALATVGARLAVGYGDGAIEMRSWNGENRQQFLDTGTKRVTFLAPGVRETVMAGYDDGLFGLWLLSNGSRLLSEKLHGSIVDVLQRDSIVRVVTALGQIRDIDLRAFHIPYCDLLAEVRKRVQVTWGDGRPVLQPAQDTEDCDPERAR